MDDWPAIDEPELLRRLSLTDSAFVELMRGFVASVGRRELTDEGYALALGYPWPRPPSSFLLDDGHLAALDGPPPDDGRRRWPLLAFGSNGSPQTLTRKLAHLPPGDRRIPVVAGDLHDFDAGAAAAPAAYGSFPATLFTSPGTALRASVLWVTGAQLTALTWTEASYRLGRLDGIAFDPDDAHGARLERVLAFSSRWGSHCVDGGPAALAALPARGRSAAQFTQEELLDRLAIEALGAGASARDLVALILEDFAAAAERVWPLTQATARPLDSPCWEPLPAAAA